MRRIILPVLMMLALAITPAFATAAQPAVTDTSFVSEFSGDEIDLGTSGEVVFIEEDYSTNEYRSGWEEFIWFTTGWSNFQMILVGGENTATYYTEVTLENMEEFYDSFEVVESDISDTDAFFVANATLGGNSLVVHYNFQVDAYGDTDLGLMQFTPADSLARDFATVQDQVTVNGDPILPNVNAMEVAALVSEDEIATPADDEGSGSTDVVRTQRTSTTEETENTDSTEDPDRPGVAGLNDLLNDSADADEPVATATVTDTGVDLESMGLISDTEWESPSFGTSLTWDGALWSMPMDYEYAIVLNEDPVYDVITLETNDGLGYVFVTVQDQGERTPLTEASYWNSPEYLETFEAETSIVEVTSTQNTAAVVYETLNARDQPLYVVITATFLEDGTVVYTQISAAPDTIHDVYGQFVDGVEANGAPLDLTYTVNDVTELSGN